MKKIVILLAVLFLSTMISASSSRLTITVNNLYPVKENLIIVLCNSEANFKYDVNPYKKKNVLVSRKSVNIIFTGLPFGDYAVKVIHGENLNDKLDTNTLRIPKETFGFSNDATGMLRPPEFSDAKISLDSDISISITMKKM